MKLNADLGEHEPLARTRALMRLIDMANIACGVHAGSHATMERCVKLALEHGVEIGAHPGLAEKFGRGAAKISPKELEGLIVGQVSELAAIAGARMRHVKLHGALYHAVEQSAVLAKRYVETVRGNFSRCRIVALAGGRVGACCAKSGVKFLPEAFAERGYLDDGTLVPRGKPGDLITSPANVAMRIRALVETGSMAAVSGRMVRIAAATICVHSDT
ncbi:MAG: 5-oxoprolinase subunit PxpA, partial [Chthoniobacterales bacterium]